MTLHAPRTPDLLPFVFPVYSRHHNLFGIHSLEFKTCFFLAHSFLDEAGDQCADWFFIPII